MRQGLYVVYDAKAGQSVGGMHVFRHDAPAVRMFSDLYADQQTVIHRHPKDFSLVRVGHFDDELLEVIPHEHVTVVTAEAIATLASSDSSNPTEALNRDA